MLWNVSSLHFKFLQKWDPRGDNLYLWIGCLDGGSYNSYESTMFKPAKQARSNLYK